MIMLFSLTDQSRPVVKVENLDIPFKLLTRNKVLHHEERSYFKSEVVH